jgi:RNA polymerase sigma-70 factor (ECF subfamily)
MGLIMARFPTTQWRSVAEAGDRLSPGGDNALAEICRCYWYPIYSFIRSRGYSADEAAELTQDYFARLLEGRLLKAADHRRGRFRTLLRTDCGYFLADQQKRRRTLKRGGGFRELSLDAAAADHRFHREQQDRWGAERRFDRAWALDVLSRALARLEREEIEAGRGMAFESLRTVFTDVRSISHATLARQLGTTESAIDGAVRRLRKRYQRALRVTVVETLDNPTTSEVDDEIRELFVVLSQ